MKRQVNLKTVWKKKKIVIVFLTAILAAMLMSFSRPLFNMLHSIKRRDEVRRILLEHWTAGNPLFAKLDFRTKGPLTISQVETELFGTVLNSNSIDGTYYQGTDLGKAWGSIKSKYQDGDELYFFTSDKHNWGQLMGRQGYVLIRKNEVVDQLVTLMN